MLQVDENIGGRQDQKYYGLRTKMSAVGLLMMVGCFVVGYFSAATTTTINTTMAQTLVSTQNVDGLVTITNKTPYLTDHSPHIVWMRTVGSLAAGNTWTASSRTSLVSKITASLAGGFFPGHPYGLVCAPYISPIDSSISALYDDESHLIYNILMKGDDPPSEQSECCVLRSDDTQKCP